MTMRILYIFPHPDDESFGPASAISYYRRTGHEVFLLTLTKGGATKERFKFDYTVQQMGEVRFAEMKEVAKALQLSGMTVLDFADSGLKETDPRLIEKAIAKHIEKIAPDVLVTYPVHGVSGFHDHLVTHQLVKRVFLELKSKLQLQRLAFYTLTQAQADKATHHQLSFSSPQEIDCVLNVEQPDVEALKKALACYKTYQDMIEKTGVKNLVGRKIYFEFFQESYDPPVDDLLWGLK